MTLHLTGSNELENGESKQSQYSSDSFESITLRLTESSANDYSVSSRQVEVNETDKKGCPYKLRRGRRPKDFQREILPGLTSLSRHDICEDINSIGEIVNLKELRKNRSRKVGGGNWCSPVRSRRSRSIELQKQSSCSLQLTNKTDQYVAFKVKTTNPKNYCVRPNTGIVLPGTTCDVTVTMQAQKEAPPDMQCKDKFLLQSVAAHSGATTEDITPEMFNKEVGKTIEEFKFRVVYIPANPPLPGPEGSEEGSSPNGNQNTVLFDAVTRSVEEPKEKSSEELMRKEISKSRARDFSFLFVVWIGLLGILVGYFMNKT
ncbi:hypothetical protein HHK36_000977 [Tetracentron sinense]|uniref:MSP domain-containing protein n=1 Tax=Tetracentron sinense TaxID=13715 RepID=A0A834ZWT9_TETSI|nr:hypothetical protein HHK36_000977 [Tetracentron sinense]